MGVDYDRIGGIGIELTNDMMRSLCINSDIPDEEWEDDPDYCLDRLKLNYERAGSEYSGEIYYYLLVKGDTFIEVNKNIPEFIEKLDLFGIDVKVEDLKVISDLYIW